jgi:hypothetical protein
MQDLVVRVESLEAKLKMADEQLFAQEQILAWLLSQQPQALNFLQAQANALDENPQTVEFVALLDSLIESVRERHALNASPPSRPRQGDASGAGCLVSDPPDEYLALRGMFLALVYELNEHPDFPRKGLIECMGNVAAEIEADGKAGAARLLGETRIGLMVNLGDGD